MKSKRRCDLDFGVLSAASDRCLTPVTRSGSKVSCLVTHSQLVATVSEINIISSQSRNQGATQTCAHGNGFPAHRNSKPMYFNAYNKLSNPIWPTAKRCSPHSEPRVCLWSTQNIVMTASSMSRIPTGMLTKCGSSAVVAGADLVI